MSRYPQLPLPILALVFASGCANQSLVMPKAVETVQPEVIKAKPPLQIATWSPNKYDGRLTAMTVGYLTVFNNCLALTLDNKARSTKENTYLLVLVDTSFVWDTDKARLQFEGKSYGIGDELYLGGGAFTYPNGILSGANIKLNWIDCGLDKGWLGI